MLIHKMVIITHYKIDRLIQNMDSSVCILVSLTTPFIWKIDVMGKIC